MSVNLLGEREYIDLLVDRIRSREWYIIPGLSPASSELMILIETTHYAGEANADFELLLGPLVPGAFSIAFAHKRRMTHEQLLALLRLPDDAGETDGQDVLIALEPDAPAELTMAAIAFANWYDQQIANLN